MQKSIWIYGAGGMGKETLWLIEEMLANEINVLGFVDDFKLDTQFKNLPLLNKIEPNSNVIIAVADSKIRKQIKESNKFDFVNIIHPNIKIHDSNSIGIGNIICKGVELTVDIKIGDHVIININSTIGHDAIIENFVSIMFGVHISGNTKIGNENLIGTGSITIPAINIGNNNKIGAGTVVIFDIPNEMTVVGSKPKMFENK